MAQESMETNGEHSEGFQKLIDYGINSQVAEELDKLYQSGIMQHSELDERALDALKEFDADGAIEVLKEFKDSDLKHVSNKSAYLCGIMKTHRLKEKNKNIDQPAQKKPGPDEDKLKAILERTGYSLDVTTGQRKYGGPPPDWDGIQPGPGHEVFCGKIPRDVFEDELIPIFEECGGLWDLRLMMDPLSGLNRGYAFLTFSERDSARKSVEKLDNYEIKPGKRLKVNISIANLRLFVGNIPKSKSRDEIREEFSKYVESITDVIIYSSADEPKKKNRGFAFLEFSTHKDASVAKRKLANGRQRVWGCDIIVDWADPQEEPDDSTMSKVKVLYVRNLRTEVTEESLKETFEKFGKVDRVKKIKDYGFVHFEERDNAVAAMDSLNGSEICGAGMEVSLAKPPNENKKKEKRQQQRMMGGGRQYYDDFYPPPPPGRMPMGGGRGRMSRQPQDYEYGYGYEGYPDYRGGYSDDYYGDYYGYDDYGDYYGGGYGAAPRARGRGGPPPPPPGRTRGGPSRGSRGGAGAMVARGARGARGMLRGSAAGRGARGVPRGAQQRGNKRKAGGDHNQTQMKKRNTSDNWGAQPIAQQPLSDQSTWYEDSYAGQQWG